MALDNNSEHSILEHYLSTRTPANNSLPIALLKRPADGNGNYSVQWLRSGELEPADLSGATGCSLANGELVVVHAADIPGLPKGPGIDEHVGLDGINDEEKDRSMLVIDRRQSTLSELRVRTADSSSYREYWTRAYESLSREPTNLDFAKLAIYCARTADTIEEDPNIASHHPLKWTARQKETFDELRRRRAAGEGDFPASGMKHALVTPQFASLPMVVGSTSLKTTEDICPAAMVLQAGMIRLRLGERYVIFDKADTYALFEGETTAWGDTVCSSILFAIQASQEEPIDAVVLVALTTRSMLDDAYLEFLGQVMSQLSSGLLGVRPFAEKLQEAQFRSWDAEQQKMAIRKALDERSEELRKVENTFKRVVDVLPCGLWLADAHGTVTYANDAWYRLTGHSREKPLMTFFDALADGELERANVEFARYWAPNRTGKPLPQDSAGLTFRWRGETSEGLPRWTSNLAASELDSEGNVVSVVGIIADISQRMRAEELQQKKAEDAVNRKKRLNRFVDLMSHELRNPLAAVTSCVELMSHRLKDMQASSQDKELIDLLDESLIEAETIHFCLAHMNRLVDETLALSKLEHDFRAICFDVFQPEALVRNVVRMYEAELFQKSITHNIHVGEGLSGRVDTWIRSDSSKVMQIIVNFLSNAIKFTEKSDVRKIDISIDLTSTKPYLPDIVSSASISLEEAASDAEDLKQATADPVEVDSPTVYFVVSVKDTGVGLTDDQQHTLFKRFSQVGPKTQTTYGGSGLGLYVSRRIAIVLGGRCGIESEEHKGSTFSFFISTKISQPARPAAVARVSSFSLPLHEKVVAPEPVPPRKYSVLLVEDNLINQKLLVKQLVKQGCTVLTADNGNLAIEALLAHGLHGGIDICLMDVEMPVCDGLTATERIRMLEKQGKFEKRLKILGCTANARDAQIQQCLDAGMDSVLTKPFAILTLMARLHSMVPLSI